MPDNFKTLRELASNSSNSTKRRANQTAAAAQTAAETLGSSKSNATKVTDLVPPATPFMTGDFLKKR